MLSLNLAAVPAIEEPTLSPPPPCDHQKDISWQSDPIHGRTASIHRPSSTLCVAYIIYGSIMVHGIVSMYMHTK